MQTQNQKFKDPIVNLFRRTHQSKAIGVKSAQNFHLNNDIRSATSKITSEKETKKHRIKPKKRLWRTRFDEDDFSSHNEHSRKLGKSNRPNSMVHINKSDKSNDFEFSNHEKCFKSPKLTNGNLLDMKSRKERPFTSKNKRWITNHIDDYGWNNNNMFSGFLRNPANKKMSKYYTSQESNWNDRFAIPFSELNEAVYRKYRINFDNMQ